MDKDSFTQLMAVLRLVLGVVMLGLVATTGVDGMVQNTALFLIGVPLEYLVGLRKSS